MKQLSLTTLVLLTACGTGPHPGAAGTKSARLDDGQTVIVGGETAGNTPTGTTDDSGVSGPLPFGWVSGTVQSTAYGCGVETIVGTLEVADANDVPLETGATDSNGHFSFALPVGRYLLHLVPPDGAYHDHAFDDPYLREVEVTADAGIPEVFDLTMTGTVRGLALRQDGTPDPQGILVGINFAYTFPEATTDADGGYEITVGTGMRTICDARAPYGAYCVDSCVLHNQVLTAPTLYVPQT